MRLILIAALLAALAGCASSKTRFWTVEPVPGPPSPSVSARAIPPIQIAVVHLPLALDRLELVRHDEADRVRVLDFDRWSAPPGALIRTALTQDLAARLPAGSVIYPDAPAPPGTRRLIVDVLALQQSGNGYTMQLSWSLLPPSGVSHQLELTAPGTGDVAGQVQAISALVGHLARDIAAAL